MENTGLNRPSGVAVDGAGNNVFVADTDNHRILRAVAHYTVTPSISTASPAGTSTFTCSAASVASGGSATCTATPAPGHTLLALTGCGSADLATGACNLANVQAHQAPEARFGLLLQGTTVPATGPGGAASATVAGGGAGCAFDAAATGFVAAGATPAGQVAPQGAFRFKLVGCTHGATVRVTTTWPQPVTGLTKRSSSGTFIAPASLAISGNTASFDVTDGGVGDDDGAPNGEIVDPVMPLAAAGPGGAQAIPTLGEWGLLLLSALLALLGWRRQHQRIKT